MERIPYQIPKKVEICLKNEIIVGKGGTDCVFKLKKKSNLAF